ncbi:DUF1836 domain-containing protein [Alicyclobacillus fastidiosus]|uniref:DUF1836 domain-containing protein n=1 Tax=Alicyclobacillus fastidiosus TaxID=392011 RepID=UPI0023E90AA4|nr:DUF1836 domain-containing protein [Alicyclobacillus fastidiosus]GMA64420.1 hypothetical protein GCM10025859_48600 [Alicyclobacillus fastidiosus]
MAQFTRVQMAQLLLFLRERDLANALLVVKDVLSSIRTSGQSDGSARKATDILSVGVVSSIRDGQIVGHPVPPILEKLMNMSQALKADIGFSISDIVALGNQMEFTNFSVTTVQNWVKRDVKELIATPQSGKKYSVEQVATIFIIEDFKSSLDFDAIRKVMGLIFNDPTSDEDDIIHPVDFLAAYSSIFEELRTKGTPIDEVAKRAHEVVSRMGHLTEEQQNTVESALVIAVLTLQAANFQLAAKTLASTTILSKRLI